MLRKVLAGYGANVALEDNLADALAKVLNTNPDAIPETIPNIDLGGGSDLPDTTDPDNPDVPTPTPTPTPTDPIEQLAAALADAQTAFADGEAALANGDFAAYGEAQDRLVAAISRIAAAEAILNPQSTEVEPPEDPEVVVDDGTNA